MKCWIFSDFMRFNVGVVFFDDIYPFAESSWGSNLYAMIYTYTVNSKHLHLRMR